MHTTHSHNSFTQLTHTHTPDIANCSHCVQVTPKHANGVETVAFPLTGVIVPDEGMAMNPGLKVVIVVSNRYGESVRSSTLTVVMPVVPLPSVRPPSAYCTVAMVEDVYSSARAWGVMLFCELVVPRRQSSVPGFGDPHYFVALSTKDHTRNGLGVVSKIACPTPAVYVHQQIS